MSTYLSIPADVENDINNSFATHELGMHDICLLLCLGFGITSINMHDLYYRFACSYPIVTLVSFWL